MVSPIGFIGSGRITRIMLGGWRQAAIALPEVLVHDPDPAAIAAVREDHPAVRSATLEEVAGAGWVFAALHPPVMAATLAAIRGKLRDDAVFCSLAPKVKLAVLQEGLGGFARLARMNPNAPSIVGAGYNPIAFGPGLPEADRARLLELLAPLGQSPVVDEALIETYAVISAMGPTYFGFQLAEVERLAGSFGLSDTAARQAMKAMIDGTSRLLFASEVPQSLALDLVPVRPMAAHEDEIRQILRQDLGAIHGKLTA